MDKNINVDDKVRIISEGSTRYGAIGTVVWKGKHLHSKHHNLMSVEVKFRGQYKNRFYPISCVELVTKIEPSEPKNFAVISLNGIECHDFESKSELVSHSKAISIARELQILHPTMTFGIIQLVATTTKPRTVVDIEDYE